MNPRRKVLSQAAVKQIQLKMIGVDLLKIGITAVQAQVNKYMVYYYMLWNVG